MLLVSALAALLYFIKIQALRHNGLGMPSRRVSLMHLREKARSGIDSELVPVEVYPHDVGILGDSSSKSPVDGTKSSDDTLELLLKASVIGASTGGLVVLFKTSIQIGRDCYMRTWRISFQSQHFIGP